MPKAFSTALSLGIAGLTVANLGLSTYAITGDINLEVGVDPAIALTIQSSSDGETVYGVSDPENQIVNNYTGQGITPFGVSSAQTKLLPNQKDESMWSKVTVYTNNAEGYKLTVSDTDDDTSLVSGSYTIPANTNISAGVSAWAFKGGKFADYTAMSPISSALTIAESTTKSAKDGDMTEIHYGVSTSADQATGTYTDTIVYTVTGEEAAKPEVKTPVFRGITKMQEMTTAICQEETTPNNITSELTAWHSEDTNLIPTTTLVDTRDNKTYTVSKLADGNCWMTQNLALVLGPSREYSSDNTDINGEWASVRASIPYGHLEDEGAWDKWDYNTPYSYIDEPEYGVLYNYPAAVASNYLGDLPRQWDFIVMEESVCPAHWGLPSVGIATDFIEQYKLRDADFRESVLNSARVDGYWLNQTNTMAGSGSFMRGNDVQDINRTVGFYVRCVAR